MSTASTRRCDFVQALMLHNKTRIGSPLGQGEGGAGRPRNTRICPVVTPAVTKALQRLGGSSPPCPVEGGAVPVVARLTLAAMDWFTGHLPQTGVALASPIGGVCAALIAWRIARHRFNP